MIARLLAALRRRDDDGLPSLPRFQAVPGRRPGTHTTEAVWAYYRALAAHRAR